MAAAHSMLFPTTSALVQPHRVMSYPLSHKHLAQMYHQSLGKETQENKQAVTALECCSHFDQQIFNTGCSPQRLLYQ